MVPDSIKVPSLGELEQIGIDFEAVSKLVGCIGAMDGTFFRILQPTEYGDTYYCYKKFNAIIVLVGVCVARGISWYVNAGSPGIVGDAAVWNAWRTHRNWTCR